MLGVEAHSSLPDDQNDRGNLPGQGQPGHFRPHALGQQSRVKLFEGAGLGRGDDRRTLEECEVARNVELVRQALANRGFRCLQLHIST
jgi:hypothetical protein